MKRALVVYRVNMDDQSYRGIMRKMHEQAKAINKYGYEVSCCFLKNDGIYLDNHCIVPGNRLVNTFFFYSKIGKINKHFDVVFLRYSPFSWGILSMLEQHAESKIYLDVPTYPYIYEYTGIKRILVKLLSLQENYFNKYTTTVLHSGNESQMFGCKVIHFENAIDVSNFKVSARPKIVHNKVHILIIGNLWSWQGIDRVIHGLSEYTYKENIHLHIIGEGSESKSLIELINKKQLYANITFYSSLYGSEIDAICDQCHFAFGSLAIHRKGLIQSNALKHREYAARCIPFIYAGIDPLFEGKRYIYKVELNDDPISFDDLFLWFSALNFEETTQLMKADLEWLNWESQYTFLNDNKDLE
jgi:hypothetical protein